MEHLELIAFLMEPGEGGGVVGARSRWNVACWHVVKGTDERANEYARMKVLD